jgi:hypothetical protein
MADTASAAADFKAATDAMNSPNVLP